MPMESSSLSFADWCSIYIRENTYMGSSYDLLRSTLLLSRMEQEKIICRSDDERIYAKFASFDRVIFIIHLDEYLYSIGYIKNGDKKGHYQCWYDTGQLMYEGYLNYGVIRIGCWRRWHTNGQLRSKGKYENGRKVSYWQYWYDTGQLEEEGYYENGHQVGCWKRWHLNGRLKSEGIYKDDSKVGRWRYWYDTGQLAEEWLLPK